MAWTKYWKVVYCLTPGELFLSLVLMSVSCFYSFSIKGRARNWVSIFCPNLDNKTEIVALYRAKQSWSNLAQTKYWKVIFCSTLEDHPLSPPLIMMLMIEWPCHGVNKILKSHILFNTGSTLSFSWSHHGADNRVTLSRPEQTTCGKVVFCSVSAFSYFSAHHGADK